MNRKRSILFPDLPTIFESVKLTKDQEWWIDYRSTVESLGRMLVVAPSTPAAVVAKMRAATDRILSDPKIVAEGAKKKRYIKYIPAAEAAKMVQTVINSVNDKQKAEISKVVLGK